jgi:hypothetical protein
MFSSVEPMFSSVEHRNPLRKETIICVEHRNPLRKETIIIKGRNNYH